jgi:predicted metal-binding protein
MDNQAIAELKRLFELQTESLMSVVDLKNISVIDREVMHFLMNCEADGVKLENCPAYIREWMEREKD